MKAIYFEYPSEYNEFFEKLSDKLHEINITDNKKYWCRPFQDNTYIKDNNKKMTKLKICLSPIISEYAITNEKEKEKMDLQIDEMWQELLNEDENIKEDKKIRKLDFIEENTFSKRQNGMTNEDRRLLDSNFKELGNKINEIIDVINKGDSNV